MWQTKSVKVTATQTISSGDIETNRPLDDRSYSNVPELESYYAGDWIVTTPNGVSRVWSDEEFRERYEFVTP
jgi:hypothetical protein